MRAPARSRRERSTPEPPRSRSAGLRPLLAQPAPRRSGRDRRRGSVSERSAFRRRGGPALLPVRSAVCGFAACSSSASSRARAPRSPRATPCLRRRRRPRSIRRGASTRTSVLARSRRHRRPLRQRHRGAARGVAPRDPRARPRDRHPQGPGDAGRVRRLPHDAGQRALRRSSRAGLTGAVRLPLRPAGSRAAPRSRSS